MWIPQNLIVKNLMSHVDTTFVFQQGEVTLLVGNNLDDPGQRSNGSGKSVLVEALAYIYTGSGLKKVVDSDLVRDYEESSFVKHTLYNSRTKDKLEIQREIFAKGSSTLKIFINDIDQKDKFPTVPEGNKLILDLIGISRKDLLSYYIISKEKYVSFYSSGDTEKKEAIARFSKSDKIDNIDLIIKPILDGCDEEIQGFEKEISKFEAQIETYEEQIKEEEKKDYEKIKKEQIDQYNKQIDSYTEKMEKCEKEIEWYEENIRIRDSHIIIYNHIIEKYRKDLVSVKKVDYNKKITDIDIEEKKIESLEKVAVVKKNAIEKELTESRDFLAVTNNILVGIITCPKCSYEFSLDNEIDIEELKLLVPTIEEGISALENKFSNYEKEIKKYKAKYTDFDKRKGEYRSKMQDVEDKKSAINLKIKRCESGLKSVDIDIKNNKNFIDTIKDKKGDYNKSIVDIRVSIKEIKKQSKNDQINKIQIKINELKSSIKNKQKEVQKEETKKFKHEQWIYNFKRFKSFLANKSIKNIEGLSNMMLNKMKSNLQIRLDGYSILKSRDLREKITASVLRNGFDEGSFFKKSGGEKGRIEIATISAMQQLINLSTVSGGLDLLIVDEILESVDGEGIIYIANAANKLGKTINIITHVDIPTIQEYKVIIIEKQNKISKII